MKSVVYGQDERVINWVHQNLTTDAERLGSVALGLEEDGELIAGVVFGEYTGVSICMHVAAVPGKRWMTRDYLWRSFAYPFLQLKCARITAIIREDNVVSQRFVEHIGFKREGVIRCAAKDGTDHLLYGMLRHECRWLRIKT